MLLKVASHTTTTFGSANRVSSLSDCQKPNILRLSSFTTQPSHADCAVCADDYSPGTLGRCHTCSTEHRGLATGLAIGVLASAVLVAVWLVPRLVRRTEGEERTRRWRTLTSSCTFASKALPLPAIKIVVVVFQIITQVCVVEDSLKMFLVFVGSV